MSFSSNKQKIPPIVRFGALTISLIAFVVGFWYTHLGLKEMRPFESDYGSIFIAIIILFLLLIFYFFAVLGHKIALIFYLICAGCFFVFNLNYFYPSYLSRKLVTEEATFLNNTLQNYVNVPLGDIDQVKDTENYLRGKDELKRLQKEYTPKLNSIIKDDVRIALDDVKNHSQIKTLSSLVNAINNNTDLINKSCEQKEFPQKKLGGKEGGAKTLHLGNIKHTFTSIGERINRIDTWAIIFLCLFINLLLPLTIYMLIRSSDKSYRTGGTGPKFDI